MKARIADSRGVPVPQFIVEAENEIERQVLKTFCMLPSWMQDKYEFWLHGYCISGDVDGVTSFNFGWKKQEDK